MKINKGQIFSSDFLIGVIVLLFVLTSLQIHYSNLIQKMNHQEKLLYRETLISRTDTLVMFSGEPINWNQNNVKTLGFSTGEPNHINVTKLEYFSDMDPEKAKRLLGLRGLDFYFAVKNTSGVLVSDFSKGNKDWGDAKNVYTVRRKVFLEGRNQNAMMELVVW